MLRFNDKKLGRLGDLFSKRMLNHFMLVKTYFEDRQMEGSGNLEASSLPCFETVSSAKN